MNPSKITVLCEDKQHAAFIRRFFRRRKQRPYFVQRPGGGAGDQFVRDSYPVYLDAVRKRGGILVVMIDGDNHGVEQRHRQMDEACRQRRILPRNSDDKIAIFVLTRSIETWFAYLDGKRVNETDAYPRLERQRECSRHVNALAQMCAQGNLRTPSPVSLQAACHEYQRIL